MSSNKDHEICRKPLPKEARPLAPNSDQRTKAEILESVPVKDPTSAPRKRSNTMRGQQERIRNFGEKERKPRNFQELAYGDLGHKAENSQANAQDHSQRTHRPHHKYGDRNQELEKRLEYDRNFTQEGWRPRDSAIVELNSGYSLHADIQGRLPPGWEMVTDPQGRLFYLNRALNFTTFRRPTPEVEDAFGMPAVPLEEIFKRGEGSKGKGNGSKRTPTEKRRKQRHDSRIKKVEPGPRKSSLGKTSVLISRNEEQKRFNNEQAANEIAAGSRAGRSAALASELQRKPAQVRRDRPSPPRESEIRVKKQPEHGPRQSVREQPGPLNRFAHPDAGRRPIKIERGAPVPGVNQRLSPIPDFSQNRIRNLPAILVTRRPELKITIPQAHLVTNPATASTLSVPDRGPNRSPVRQPPLWTEPSPPPKNATEQQRLDWLAKENRKREVRDQHWRGESKREAKRMEHWKQYEELTEQRGREVRRRWSASETIKKIFREVRRRFDLGK